MIKYTPSFVPNRIVVFGTGGTGSRLVPLLAQFIKTCNWVIDPKIYLCDFDVVEEKNLLRQNFILPDVGKNKAAVLANRYSKAYGVGIVPITCKLEETAAFDPSGHKAYLDRASEDPQKVCNEKMAYELYSSYLNNTIIVMCVDSPEARRSILSSLVSCARNNSSRNGMNTLLFDTGNENDFGQVTWSHLTMPYLDKSQIRVFAETFNRGAKNVPYDVPLPYVPLDYAYFRDMVAVDNLSCADLDQTMAINSLVANTAFGIIQSIYYAKPLTANRYNVNLTHGTLAQTFTPQSLIGIIERLNDVPEGKEDIEATYSKWGALTIRFAPTISTLKLQKDSFESMMKEMEEKERLEREAKAKAREVKAEDLAAEPVEAVEKPKKKRAVRPAEVADMPPPIQVSAGPTVVDW